MTLERYGPLTVRACFGNRGKITGPFSRRLGPRAQLSGQNDLPEWGGLSGFLLACIVLPAFGTGLIALAVLPALDITLSRGLILAYGGGCVLLAMLALLLSGPWDGTTRPR